MADCSQANACRPDAFGGRCVLQSGLAAKSNVTRAAVDRTQSLVALQRLPAQVQQKTWPDETRNVGRIGSERLAELTGFRTWDQ